MSVWEQRWVYSRKMWWRFMFHGEGSTMNRTEPNRTDVEYGEPIRPLELRQTMEESRKIIVGSCIKEHRTQGHVDTLCTGLARPFRQPNIWRLNADFFLIWGLKSISWIKIMWVAYFYAVTHTDISKYVFTADLAIEITVFRRLSARASEFSTYCDRSS